VNPLAGQDEHETLETLFRNVDLSFAEKVVCRCFHTAGPGRHPRSPVGLFRTFIVMHMKGVRSLREMTRLLDVDVRLRKICLLKKGEKGYPRSVLSRFARKVGADKLESIVEDKVVALLKRSSASDVDAVLDASFVKAWSTRHPKDSQTGFSDDDARVGRAGRTFGLGYKLHLSIDSESRLPLANVVAPANENEKRHTPTLLEKTRQILSNAGAKLKRGIADSQYSDEKIRRTVEAVIPRALSCKPETQR
jgi:transposase